MKLLGIDPGNKRMGLASLHMTPGGIALGECEVIYHNNDNNLSFNVYLNEGIANLCEAFPWILHQTQPDVIVAEIIPVGRLGSNTELNVAAITVCKVIAWQWGIDWIDIAANTVKKTITGDGRATKAKIKHTVVKEFPSLVGRNEDIKKQQKMEGVKAEGFPQDLYDAVAVGWAGLLIHGDKKTKED